MRPLFFGLLKVMEKERRSKKENFSLNIQVFKETNPSETSLGLAAAEVGVGTKGIPKAIISFPRTVSRQQLALRLGMCAKEG